MPPNPVSAVAKAPAKILKLDSINFSQPPFRKLGSIDIKIASRVTLIAGRNGVGKSTILALIAGGSGLTRGSAKNGTYFGTLPNVLPEEILKLSFLRDFVKEEVNKPHFILGYTYSKNTFFKKGNVSGSEERLRIVPRNEPKGKLLVDGLEIPADGKVPIPTIYLGMTRVLPIGEAVDGSVVQNVITMDAEDYQIYAEFTNRVIPTGNNEHEGKVVSQTLTGTKKRSVYPDYKGYDSTNVSLGQDSLSAIATALASFSKQKRKLGSGYKGGLLIIDELDAGFHPHAQIELLNELKSKARQLSIQVIATTHSLTMLEHLHADIHNPKKTGTPLDQIIYLKAGVPIELLDAAEYDAIHADMHMMLRPPKLNKVQSIKVYLEDEEAALFLNAILTPVRIAAIKASTNCKLDVIAVKVGCSNLIGLLKADDHFKSVLMVLDADTTTVNTNKAPNIVRLPVDPLNSKKQSPEVIIKNMCEIICTNPTAYPKTRAILKKLGGDTTYIDSKINCLQRGEKKPEKSVETDREVAKNWFNTRLQSISDFKIIEGWVADNEATVAPFIKSLETAIRAVALHNSALVPPK